MSPKALHHNHINQSIVVGAGVGGLAAAIHLARAGQHVILLEKNQQVGGKLNQWIAPHPHRPGHHFRFDMGPSLITLPHIFDELFVVGNASFRQRLNPIPLDPVAEFRWADGECFKLRSDTQDLIDEVKRIAPTDAFGFRRLLQRSKEIWDLSADTFLYHPPPDKRKDFKPTLFGILGLFNTMARIGMHDTFARTINTHVENPRLRHILWQYATYSGASPFHAPATLVCILHAEHHFGGYYLPGGLYQLADSLRQVAESMGVEVRCNAEVTQLLVDDNTTQGVQLKDGEQLKAGTVICNADVVDVFERLIPPEQRPHMPNDKLHRMEPGGSGMILLLGVDRQYPQLAHHTKFMPTNYRDDLQAMFAGGSIPADPCIYVCASTRTDPSQAPEGCENLFVLVSAPPLSSNSLEAHQEFWRREGQAYRDRVVHTLEHRFGLTDLGSKIVVERRLTPVDLRELYYANRGSIYGIGSNRRIDAFFRPPNEDPQIKGLYFAGGATHPGGGLPLVALSGKIAAELALGAMAEE